MVKKIFTSSSNRIQHGLIKIGHPQHLNDCDSEYEISIGIFKNEISEFPESFIILDKSTAVSFVNELKREIAKLKNLPF